MKDAVLLELAQRWMQDAEMPQAIDGSEEAREQNAYERGCRETKRECADGIRTLVDMLGDQ